MLVVEDDLGVAQRGMASRALRRHRYFDGAIDLLGRRDGSMAGRMSALASRPLGIGLGCPLGEGGGLTLPGPLGLLQLGLEPFHLGAKLLDLAGLTPGQIDKFLVCGRFGIHDESFTRQAA